MLARLVLAVALSLVPSLASAQEPPGDGVPEPDPNEEEARALFVAGRAAFGRGELERALDHFTRGLRPFAHRGPAREHR